MKYIRVVTVKFKDKNYEYLSNQYARVGDIAVVSPFGEEVQKEIVDVQIKDSSKLSLPLEKYKFLDEVIPSNTVINKALELKRFCSKVEDCEECPFMKNEICIFDGKEPCSWDIEEETKLLSEKEKRELKKIIEENKKEVSFVKKCRKNYAMSLQFYDEDGCESYVVKIENFKSLELEKLYDVEDLLGRRL